MPQNCPVCNNVSNNIAKCSQCGWDLTPVDWSEYPKTSLEKWQNDQIWTAKRILSQPSRLKTISEKIDYLTQGINELLLQQKNTPLPIPNLEENQQVPKLTEQIEQLKSQLKEMSERMQKLESDNNYLHDRVEKLQNNQVTEEPSAPLLSEVISQDRREVTKEPSAALLSEVIPYQEAEYNFTITPTEEDIVRQYSSDSLSAKVIEVGVTTESFNRRYSDVNQPLELKRENGGYWIIEKDDSQYLVPKTGLKINQAKYDSSAKVLFECLNYQEGITRNWQLVKPALVSIVGEIWQLKERGVLQFN